VIDDGGSVALLPEGTEGGFGFPADDGQQDARRACGLVCQKFTVHSLQFTVRINDAATVDCRLSTVDLSKVQIE